MKCWDLNKYRDRIRINKTVVDRNKNFFVSDESEEIERVFYERFNKARGFLIGYKDEDYLNTDFIDFLLALQSISDLEDVNEKYRCMDKYFGSLGISLEYSEFGFKKRKLRRRNKQCLIKI